MKFPKKSWRYRSLNQRRSSAPGVRREFDDSNQPKLSVVVPCYMVERYLPGCLDSILAQNDVDLQVVIVDDGSPDASGEIAEAYAFQDNRISVVRQSNSGLGAARNTGIRHSQGKYITFADSDDFVPAGSYAALVSSLEATGSDFAVGSIERLHLGKKWTPAWAQEVHREDRLRSVLSDDPEILKNVFAWNKVFRRSFWDRVVGEFPEGVRYEDQEPTARAYIGSDSFDVLNKVVYTWVIRDDGTSITQQKANIDDLRDRLCVMGSVHEVLERGSEKDTYIQWLIKSIGFDLKPYYEQVPRTSDEYWEVLKDGVAALAGRLRGEDWARVPFWDRLYALSAVFGNQDDVALIMARRQEQGTGYAVTARGNELICSADFLSELSFRPTSNYLVVPAESMRLNAELRGAVWRPDGSLTVSGRAHISGLGEDRTPVRLRAFLLPVSGNLEGERRVELDVERYADASIDAFGTDAYNSYSTSAFNLHMLPGELALPTNGWKEDLKWKVHFEVEAAGILRSGSFNHRSVMGTAGTLTHGPLFDGVRVALQFDETSGLILNVPLVKPIARSIQIDDRRVRIRISGGSRSNIQSLMLRGPRRTEAWFEPTCVDDQDAWFDFELPSGIRKNFPNEVAWEVRVSDGKTSRVVQYEGSTVDILTDENVHDRVGVELSGNGFLRFIDNAVQVRVTNVSRPQDDHRIEIGGEANLPEGMNLRLYFDSGAGSILADSLTLDRNTGRFEAVFALKAQHWGYDDLVVPQGGYALKASMAGIALGKPPMWVKVGLEAQVQLPLHWSSSSVRVRLARTKQAAALWLNVYPPLPVEDMGRFAQRQLQRRIPKPEQIRRYTDATLFESFGGSTVSDSPRALLEHARENGIGGQLYCTVKDFSTPVPDGVTPVVLHSSEYYRVLHSVRTLVNNNNFPHYFRKGVGQRYLQTWHGTPLKRIGNDVPKSSLSQSYRQLMNREVRFWDHLLAQSEYAAETLKRAFAFESHPLVLGYPRNDQLVRAGADSAAYEVRKALGIDPSCHVVLYAPTWRDNRRASNRHYDLVSYLDTKSIYERFGSSVKILLRGHSNTIRSGRSFNSQNTIDVSAHPSINELMLASDSLITDYSSIMFDYCVTGKPIYILAPDLQEYSSSVRGFYFDLLENAPGPLFSTTDELADHMENASTHQPAAKFHSVFAPLDDGNSSRRVAKVLWR